MASELIQDLLNHPLFGNLGQAPDVKSWARGVCVGSPMLDKIWSENVLISGRHPSSYKLILQGWVWSNPSSKSLIQMELTLVSSILANLTSRIQDHCSSCSIPFKSPLNKSSKTGGQVQEKQQRAERKRFCVHLLKQIQDLYQYDNILIWKGKEVIKKKEKQPRQLENA